MEQLLFSIIIPAYNSKTYIRDCIESLEHQYEKCFEAIVVDDGSTDGTSDICDSLITEFPNVKIVVLHQKNSGQIAARLNGIDHAVGDYCIFLDSDDKLAECAISVLKDAVSNFKTDIVIYNGYRFQGEDKIPLWHNYSESPYYMTGEKYRKFQIDALTTNRFNNVWLKAIKRKIILHSIQYNDADLVRREEDYLMQLPWYDTAKTAVYIPRYLYLYRVNSSSVTMQRFDKNAFDAAIYIYKKAKPFYKKWGANLAINRERFINNTISYIKQIYNIKKQITYVQKKSILTRVMNDDVFRNVYSKYKGRTGSMVGRLAVWLLYHKMWRLALFVIEKDPKVHGTDKVMKTFSDNSRPL